MGSTNKNMQFYFKRWTEQLSPQRMPNNSDRAMKEKVDDWRRKHLHFEIFDFYVTEIRYLVHTQIFFFSLVLL